LIVDHDPNNFLLNIQKSLTSFERNKDLLAEMDDSFNYLIGMSSIKNINELLEEYNKWK